MALLVLVLQVPSLRAVFKYAPLPWLLGPALLVLAAAAYVLLLGRSRLRERLERPLASPAVAILLLGAIALATWRIYPMADALKLQGRGSTADDALIEPLRAWLAGRPLYSVRLMGGVPPSPGPGWIFLNAPFTASGGYFLLTASYVGVFWSAVFLRRRRLADANLALLLLVSSLAFWELTVTGHDVVATSCAIGALLLWTGAAFERRSSAGTFALAVLWGTLATARILYPFLLPLLGLLFWRWDRRRAALLAGVGLAVAGLWHLPFLLTTHPYPPFHLWGRAREGMGTAPLVAGAALTAVMGLVAARRARPTRASVEGWFVLCFLVPLLFVSAGELIAVGGKLARWEGANYLIPVVGPLLALLCTERVRQQEDPAAGVARAVSP